MLKCFGYWAGLGAVFGVISLGSAAAAAASAENDSGSTKPTVSRSSKSASTDAQHSNGQAAVGSVGSVDTVARRSPTVRPAAIMAVNSRKPTHLIRAKPSSKLVKAEKRTAPAVKVAAVRAVETRPNEINSTNAVRAEDVSALPIVPPLERSTPIALMPTNLSMQPGDAYAHARSLEGDNQTANAIPLYAEASRQGHSAASLRLMEIYAMGAEGVSRNYIAAVEFKRLAVQQGARLEYPPHR